ncbi:DUF4256 domain-containing protein [Sphingobacterium sp. 1.A.5]|uniref:DUF4256 domain-containing protein n=1 Tax=Sphingobacterium sp. 1.A.5 TaxID=2044604 RepID=UPI000C0BC52F|nr:DUF4256 domain-containing protein [Sphingobacterium sp. 1.A.5]
MKTLEPQRIEELITVLKKRFEKNMHRHPSIKWDNVEKRLMSSKEKLWSINEMEETEGEPDVVSLFDNEEIIYVDCSAESPKGRRSLCYDQAALESRKEHKPKDSAMNMAHEMGIELLSEEEYSALQSLGKFDNKTSSWLKTSPEVRKLGGAVFGDLRYNRVFFYHNGAESYYAARGFRGLIKL